MYKDLDTLVKLRAPVADATFPGDLPSKEYLMAVIPTVMRIKVAIQNLQKRLGIAIQNSGELWAGYTSRFNIGTRQFVLGSGVNSRDHLIDLLLEIECPIELLPLRAVIDEFETVLRKAGKESV